MISEHAHPSSRAGLTGLAVKTFCTIKLAAVTAWISAAGSFLSLGTKEVTMALSFAAGCVVRLAVLGGRLVVLPIRVGDEPA